MSKDMTVYIFCILFEEKADFTKASEGEWQAF